MEADAEAPRRLSPGTKAGVGRDAAKTISARKKVKCSGDKPCTYCHRRDLECRFPEPGKKRVYSVTRIQDLQERLARYESQGLVFAPVDARVIGAGETDTVRVAAGSPRPATGYGSTPADNATQVNAASTLLGLALDQLGSPSAVTTSRGNTSNVVDSSPGSAIAADSSLSSSHAFGSRLQNLLEHPRGGREDPSRRTSIFPQRPSAPRDQDDAPPSAPLLPSEEEARRLFESMSFFIGYTQHHVDTREFSDRLAFFYANLHEDQTQKKTPWYLEMLLVFAVGKLFSGSFDGDGETEGIPGWDTFRHVEGRMPSLSGLYEMGALGVEVQALAAVYLQNANRKEEAYLYISSALRLAMTYGYHRSSGTRHLLQSEKVHLNRLWWTVYMQERRLAAATGNPSGISDEVIEIDMPNDSPGFPPALPLRTNIKIARVTGRILSTIYGPGNHPEETFVPGVQDIVQSLYWIAKEIPGDFSGRLSGLPSIEGDVSMRTSAYLHMMLYQAILLTIRPVMLHVSKLIFDEEDNGGGLGLGTSPLGRLSRTCSEAARRLLDVLTSLRKTNMLTTFGFFDLDAIFSAAFIMILTLVIDSTRDEGEKTAPTPGLADALEILDYLAGRGNKFALQRAREARRMRDLLARFLNIPKSSPREGARRGEGDRPPKSVGDGTGAASQLGSRSLLDSSLWNDISYLWMQQPSGQAADEDAQQLSFEPSGVTDVLMDDTYDYYSIYHNQDLALTGQDLGDFGELERHILGFGGE
ncbi:fungal specific transcription factor domain-containing protein [Colletotrichum plurivorum]|uniref:Fungal specific transcription factor domain-containing protein n=1 Tax=Colletotrichum plurivorum TaxID=2175906 RepID=A0A8H6J9Q8_9PEZI|nr:fungal specific transcription factor domain-containing protein [Colletotrichum plurivorum]